jgi:hypothetical protein
MTRYVFPCTIVNVEERTQIRRGYKDAHGDAQFDYEVIGYYAILSRGNVAIYLGMDAPDFKPGDNVRLIVEPVI